MTDSSSSDFNEISSTIEVVVAIAINQDGVVDSCVYDSIDVRAKLKYEIWLNTITNDKNLWVIKYVKTKIPLPLQFEEVQ